jgi:hypothetical protein
VKQSAKITIAAILVIGVFSISIATAPAFADWGKFSYPQIQGTVPVSSGDDFEQKNGIALSVAMAVGENSVSDGKAMYAKLADVNGFLVHKVILITEDHGYYKVLVDAGNGEALYVSDMIKKDYSHKKASNEKHNEKIIHIQTRRPSPDSPQPRMVGGQTLGHARIHRWPTLQADSYKRHNRFDCRQRRHAGRERLRQPPNNRHVRRSDRWRVYWSRQSYGDVR